MFCLWNCQSRIALILFNVPRSPVTDEELEREAKELEEKVRRLRDEEVLLKQMLDGTVTKQQLKNRLNFYKFSGTVKVLTTDDSVFFVIYLMTL